VTGANTFQKSLEVKPVAARPFLVPLPLKSTFTSNGFLRARRSKKNSTAPVKMIEKLSDRSRKILSGA